jgi:energy-converting hydrogenase Eha subunit A
MITKSDVFKKRLFKFLIRAYCVELVALIVLAIIGDGAKFALVTSVITALAAGLCMAPTNKRKIFDAWEKFGQPLSAFPITTAERLIAANVAQKLLRELAQNTTDAFEARAALRSETHKVQSEYLYGFPGLEMSSEREDVRQQLVKLEALGKNATHAAMSANNYYCEAWDFFTKPAPGMDLLPGLVRRFPAPENFRSWVFRNFQYNPETVA